MSNNYDDVEIDARAGVWKNLSWSAIIAGMVTALSVQLVLTMLGAAVGAAMANPYSDPSTTHVGVGAIVWLILSGIISFGIGGYVAGWAAGVVRPRSGATHGLLAWATAAVLGTVVAALAGSATLGGVASGAGAATNHVSLRGAPARTDDLASGVGRERAPTDAEARAAAERAAEIAAQVSLWTAIAFILSMGAAAVAGSMGGSRAEGGGLVTTNRAGVTSRPAMG